ncbi:hypothetical protein GOP47_0026783 [Adiantum capillus-veneris]|nr:hypothetical protein GOP47_0026783 [Adiantum capillus-veneris]
MDAFKDAESQSQRVAHLASVATPATTARALATTAVGFYVSHVMLCIKATTADAEQLDVVIIVVRAIVLAPNISSWHVSDHMRSALTLYDFCASAPSYEPRLSHPSSFAGFRSGLRVGRPGDVEDAMCAEKVAQPFTPNMQARNSYITLYCPSTHPALVQPLLLQEPSLMELSGTRLQDSPIKAVASLLMHLDFGECFLQQTTLNVLYTTDSLGIFCSLQMVFKCSCFEHARKDGSC